MSRKELILGRGVLLKFSLLIFSMFGIASGDVAQKAVAAATVWAGQLTAAAAGGRDDKRPQLPPEAKAVVRGFQEALQQRDWDKALAYCSLFASSKAEQSGSGAAYLAGVVPVKEVTSMDDFRVRSWSRRSDKTVAFGYRVMLEDERSEYPLRWPWWVRLERGSWVIDFELKPLDIWVKHELMKSDWINNRISPEEKASMRKKAEQGLELRLIALVEKFVIGKPMLFCVELRNVGNETLMYEAVGGSDMVNDPVEVIGPDGATLPYMDSSYQTVVAGECIEPGETVELVEQYDVRSQYHIVKPGRYSFRLRGRWGVHRPSDAVEVEVEAGKLSPLEQVVDKLMPILPEGWHLTRTQRMLDPYEAESAECLSIAMVGEHKGKGYGIAVFVRILLDVDAEEAVADEQFGKYVGRCPWGPVFMKSHEAEKSWPDWEEELTEALGIQLPE